MLFNRHLLVVAAVAVVLCPAGGAADQAPTEAAERARDPMPIGGAAGRSCTHPLFFSHPRYPVGNRPLGVAFGDLDGVNGPDLAVANDYSDDVSVLLNQGDGSFAAAAAYPAGDHPQSVAIGDLDGVNGVDLAVTNDRGYPDYDGDVVVLLNQGDGTFAPAVVYPVGGGARGVAIGDLDGANGPDLAVANVYGDNVSVLLNQGDGTFATGVPYPAGNYPRGVAIGDLDGANGPDLAVANYYSDDISLLLNQGDGTFGAAVAYPAGGRAGSVAIGDL
ncbi:MAG: FG-GAP-like repeat-containing protein, partial [Planctomycetota bacterium]